jgi:NAD(P)-dependent dehydrogenase (short-subunit alcohol dehydrogenase family)
MNILITGANRGIGLALTNLYCAQGHDVIGVVRSSLNPLSQTGLRIISGIDVRNDSDVNTLAKKLNGTPIDLLIHNAGLLVPDDIGDVQLVDVQKQFEVNALGPLRVTQTLLPCLGENSKIAIITSRLGSMSDNSSGGYYGYRMSKAVVNAFGVSLANDLKPHGIAVAILHPGFVRTDMTGGHGQVEADESAAGLAKRIEELSIETSGQFLHMNGEHLAW